MDVNEFRLRGKEMVEYISDFMSNIHKRRVTPDVGPGYLRSLLPAEAPFEGEAWEDIMNDVENKIMPGITHWQHPRFHAYFPAGNSFPSILGDMLSDAIGCIGFSWAASPACTELETIVCDWFGKHVMNDWVWRGYSGFENPLFHFVTVDNEFLSVHLLMGTDKRSTKRKAMNLPNDFLYFSSGSTGGGVIQGSASESVLVCMLAARAQAITRLKASPQHAHLDESALLGKLMAYCSRESHSCAEKDAMICFVKLRILEPDEKSVLRGDTLRQAIEADVAEGFVPFFVSTTFGTTACCSFDNLVEIGPVCKKYQGIWLHVDAAYAGNAFICPELQYLMAGIECADSINTNANKLLLTNFDCSCLWVRDRFKLTSALVVDPLYLQHTHADTAIDYRHWSIPLSRRFRSLKLWFVMRSYGINGLRAYIRNHCKLAKEFEHLVMKDERFEVCNDVVLGLVCFRAKGSDKLNQKLLSAINDSGRIHMVPAKVNQKYTIRFALAAPNATYEDVEIAWNVITEILSEILESKDVMDELADVREKKRKATLEQRRSFFVRMVSDPAIQPGFTKTPNRRESKLETQASTSAIGSSSRSTRSWISWPLAYLMSRESIADTSELSLRFRHLDTMVRLKTGVISQGRNGNGCSPDPSPSASPARGRSPNGQA